MTQIKGRVEGDDAVVSQLLKIGQNAKPAIDATIGRLVLKLQRKVQEEKLTGQVLKVQTGTLRRSINGVMLPSPGQMSAGVVSTNVKYARIHEYGGTIKAMVIEAKKARALKFSMGGKTVFAKRVTIPERQMPERSFLRSALNEMSDEIKSELMQAATRAIATGAGK